MRFILLGASALLLAGCGGEDYPVPASDAIDTLSSIGTPVGLSPLPIGMQAVEVDFSTVPEQGFVRWRFSHEGDDLGTIFAQVTPKGDTASNVRVSYADGTAPDEKWRNENIRGLLKRQVQQLVVEAVDAKFEKRPFDRKLRLRVDSETAAASMGALFKEIDASQAEFIANEKQRKREAESRRVAYRPEDQSKPMTDLSQYNN
ncbi:MAG TPA: hypothetical protein VGB65_14005 [Allosphingosinicella sp.]|jgi:hypothetical protein